MTSMYRAYALTMTKPHETLGLPQSLRCQILQHASVAWYVLMWAVICGLLLTYIGFITTSAARGFQLRDAEYRLERLQSEARALEMEVAEVSSIHAMSVRASDLGFVAINRIESVNAAGHSYAFAR